MSRETLPRSALRFLLESIESVEQIEILLRLAADPTRAWTADAIAKELRSSPRSTRRWLDNLKAQRLLSYQQSSGEFRFAPQTDELKDRVTELAGLYSTFRVAIIEVIFNKPAARLRSFADAFKIREDK